LTGSTSLLWFFADIDCTTAHVASQQDLTWIAMQSLIAETPKERKAAEKRDE